MGQNMNSSSANDGAFQRHRGELCCEQVPLSAIAAQYGTPTYVYSRGDGHDTIFEDTDMVRVCYALRGQLLCRLVVELI